MPIRFTVDGQQWEVDTPEEAVKLRQSLVHVPQSRSNGSGNGRGPGRPPKAPAETPKTLFPTGKPARLRDVVFLPEDVPFINAMLATPNGLTTDDVMKALGVTKPLSLPPRFTTWRLRAKKHGINFNEVITRKGTYFTGGKVASVYTLTPRGRELLSM